LTWNIDADAVGAAEIAANAVGTSEINDGTVAEADLNIANAAAADKYLQWTGSAMQWADKGYIDPTDPTYGLAVGNTGAQNSTALQAAFDAAHSSGKAVATWAVGPFAVDPATTLQIKDHSVFMPNTRLTLGNPSGITLLRVKHPTAGTNISNRILYLPKIEALKTGGNGVWVASSIGIQITNAYHNTIYVPYVKDFETGLETSGDNSVQQCLSGDSEQQQEGPGL
jgi:hypothetical protein